MKRALTISLSVGIIFLAIAAPGTQAKPFVISTDGTEVTDQKTGLIWRRCAEGMEWNGSSCVGAASLFTHEMALQRATQASSTGIAWRLPNVKELSSIADRSINNPAIDSTAFPATRTTAFWAASPSVGMVTCSWSVNFAGGEVGHDVRNAEHPVRLVRDGQR